MFRWVIFSALACAVLAALFTVSTVRPKQAMIETSIEAGK